MELNLSMTAIISGAISSIINGIAVFFAIRYANKIADRLERVNKKDKDREKANGNKKQDDI